jgi:hypothetical protein
MANMNHCHSIGWGVDHTTSAEKRELTAADQPATIFSDPANNKRCAAQLF